MVYEWYLDILTNEDLIVGHIDDSTPLLNRIWSKEPVGEGEYLGSIQLKFSYRESPQKNAVRLTHETP